jgi:putative phage-type endonuclease
MLRIRDLNQFYYNFLNYENIINSVNDLNNITMDESLEKYEYDYLKQMLFLKINGRYNLYDDGYLLSRNDKALLFMHPYITSSYDEKLIQYNKLRAIISPEQRSKEWFEARHTCISASDMGCVLGLNKYEPPYKFLLKKVFKDTFETNKACYTGKKYENACVLNYEYLNDVHLEEFGLLKHETISFLGASPDSIVSPFKRDMTTKTELIGRMIEIKCLTSRKLNVDGNIYGNICPEYYYCQVQLQLECCDLNECDFIQYRIYEYEDKDEYLNDSVDYNDYTSLKSGLEKSILIELMPKHLEKEDYIDGKYLNIQAVYNKATHIYPPKIDMSYSELCDWLLMQEEYYENHETLKIYKIKYYRVDERLITLILRDKNFFNKNYNKMLKMWSYVLFLRSNLDKANLWKNYIESETRNYNNKIMDKLDEIMNSN